MSKIIIKLTLSIIFLLILLIFSHSVQAAGIAGTTIVLNAGHGGKDTGAINYAYNIYEKNLTLKISKYLETELKKYYNVKVIQTHDGVNFPKNDYNDLAARAMVARNNNADLYVSLHINSNNSSSVNGADVYVTYRKELPKYNEGMTNLGNKILDNLTTLGITKNKVRTRLCIDDSPDPKYRYYDKKLADYYGDIRYAMKGDTSTYGADLKDGSGIPTVLVEHCYLSNPHDVKILSVESNLKKMAQADAKAIVDYLGLKLPSEVVTKITVDKENLNLTVGEKEKITVTVNPTTAPNKSVKWTSSNNNVATVDENGNVTAVGIGTAKITITSIANPALTKTINVNVEKYDLKFSKEKEYILLDKTAQLSAIATPSWIKNKNLTWESDNPEIVEVSSTGVITAKKAGISNIKVSWKEQNLSDTIEVEVIGIPKDIKIDLSKYKVNKQTISKIGEKVELQDFKSKISITDSLEIVIETPIKGQNLIGTGTKVIIKEKTHHLPIEQYECLVYGDVNGDGKITPADYVKIKNHIMKASTLTGNNYIAADIDQNNNITPADYVKVKNHIMKVTTISI